MTTPYNHDSTIVTIQNLVFSTEDVTLRFKKRSSFKEKLAKINKKITKWNIDRNIIWKIEINDKTISPTDTNSFQKILSITPPPLTIQIVKVMYQR